MLLAAAALGAAAHWVGDWITGYGNIVPLWPWSSRDVSLLAVNSFDWVLFSATLAWHIAIRSLDLPRRREVAVSALWLGICAGYVAYRHHFGPGGIW